MKHCSTALGLAFFLVDWTRKSFAVVTHGQTSAFDRSFYAAAEPRLELQNSFLSEVRKPLHSDQGC